MPGSNMSRMRSTRQKGVRRPERWSREMAGVTATSTLAGDDLLPKLELSGGGFFSARRWRSSVGE
jgi:hypothetical protein